MANPTNNVPDIVFVMIINTMRNMQFLRYNIPLELASAIRPLSSIEARELQNLHLAYRNGEWSREATEKLQKLSEKAEMLASKLEELLEDNGFSITEKDGIREVIASKSPFGTRTLFTWMLPEYEEYDGGLLSEQDEEEFLADVMSGLYDDESDRRYLKHMYTKRELHEGVIPNGDEFEYCFINKQVSHYDEDEEFDEDDNMNLSDLSLL